MIIAEDIVKAIEEIEMQPYTQPKLIAISDIEEKIFKEHFPGVEVIRAPQKVGGKE